MLLIVIMLWSYNKEDEDNTIVVPSSFSYVALEVWENANGQCCYLSSLCCGPIATKKMTMVPLSFFFGCEEDDDDTVLVLLWSFDVDL